MPTTSEQVRPTDPVSRLMRRTVATIDEGYSLTEVAAELTADEVGAVVVTGAHGPVGVVTERDIVTVLGVGGDPDSRQAGEVMNAEFIWASTEETVREVGTRMCAAGVRHLLIGDGRTLQGIVSMRDVFAVLLGE
jgi:CBS domain-containing protein